MIFYLLLNQNIEGNEYKYPVTLENVIVGRSFESVEIESQKKLINFVYDRWQKDDIEKSKKLRQICKESGIHDTINLIDNRIIMLVNLFQYYNSNATPPSPYNNSIWYDTVLICEQILNKKVSLF